jgi:hypothetical protein
LASQERALFGVEIDTNDYKTNGDKINMANTDAYEKVAGVVGDEMDKAWKNIMSRLAASNVSGIAAFDGGSLTSDDLKAFFEVLGGAQMALSFQSRQPKGERVRSTSLDIEPQAGSPATLISGEISIGGSIRF